MIFVTGATGNIGTELVKQLLTKGVSLRVLTRDEAKVSHLDPSVERFIGDRHDAATVRRALAGVEKVFMLAVLFDKNHEADRLLVEEAKRAAVRHIVFISSSEARMEPKGAIGGLHREKEQLIEDSGIPWTFLHPGGFMSNALQWVGTIKSQAKVFNPSGDGKSAPISPSNIAAVAARALTSAGHEGKTYHLTGAELLSVPDQVLVLSKVIGKPIQAVDIPIEVATERAVAAGLPKVLADSLATIWIRIRDGQGAFQTDEVEQLTGRPAQTFETWSSEHRSAFV